MKIRNAILVVVVLEAAVAAAGVAVHGWSLEGLQATTRFSGRLSLLLFSLIFLFHRSRQLEQFFSPHYFLAFAVAHGIHLVELVSFVYFSGTELIPYRVAGGFIAYGFIFAMPAIQTRYMSDRLTERKYRIYCSVYLVYVWSIFFLTYLPRVQGNLPNVGGTRAEHITFFSWVLLLLVVKVVLLLKRIRKTG